VARSLALLLPGVTFAAVALVVLGPAAERPLISARLYGGPTDRLPGFTGFLAAERDGKPLAGEEIGLHARSLSGGEVLRSVRLDADGQAEISLDFGTAPPGSFELELTLAGRSIGRGRAALRQADWLPRVPQRGGFSDRPARTPNLSVAAERGSLAPPFPGALWLRVRDAEGPAQAALEVSAEGARVRPQLLEADARGLARIEVDNVEWSASVTVRARLRDGPALELSSVLPSVQGALYAEFEGNKLRVRSPVERNQAWLRLFSRDGRLLGARLALSPDGRGQSSGELALPQLPAGPLWAVVSGEPPIGGARIVGWPRTERATGPERTFDARDELLFDLGPANKGAERVRRRRLYTLAFVIGGVGAVLSILAVVRAEIAKAREFSAHLGDSLRPEEAERVAPQQRLRSALMVLLVGSGFLVLVALAAWQLLRR